jgi:hypothetical protein
VIELQSISTVDRAAGPAEAPLAPIYSFVPAGGTAHAGLQTREVARKLQEALAAQLEAEGGGHAVLLADFSHESLDYVLRQPFTVTCADLASANEEQAERVVCASNAIFVTAATDPDSIEAACQKAAWLRSIKQDDCCGLLLLPTSGGVSATAAEEITGLPVCGVLSTENRIAQVARWIALQ